MHPIISFKHWWKSIVMNSLLNSFACFPSFDKKIFQFIIYSFNNDVFWKDIVDTKNNCSEKIEISGLSCKCVTHSFVQNENVWHLSTLSLAYLQGQLQRIIDCHFISMFFLLPNSEDHAATICNWCWYLSSVTTISISFFSSHRSKNIIFLWAWGQQRIFYRRSWVRERKKKVALFYACVHIIVFRPTLCR